MTDPRKIVIESEKRALRRLFLGDRGELNQDGRLALDWLLREGRVFGRTDARGLDEKIDALSMAHLEGGRCLVLRLLLMLGLDLPGLVTDAKGEVTNDDG
jgi:hypothetical protein